MLQKDIIEVITAIGEIILPMFTVKFNNNWRLIWNERYINEFLPKEYFQMENLMVVKEIITKENYMVVLNLKNTYFYISIAL
jgi:hypothetical protein